MHTFGPPSPITIRPIPAHATRPLRHRVLRPHQTPAEMVYDGDDAPTAVHLGAFSPDRDPPDQPVGIVTLTQQPQPGGGVSCDWRLRGMAVDPAWRGRGIGRQLVIASLAAIEQRGGRRIWCNARIAAEGFYTRLGFEVRGERFEIAGIGTHVVMSVSMS